MTEPNRPIFIAAAEAPRERRDDLDELARAIPPEQHRLDVAVGVMFPIISGAVFASSKALCAWLLPEMRDSWAHWHWWQMVLVLLVADDFYDIKHEAIFAAMLATALAMSGLRELVVRRGFVPEAPAVAGIVQGTGDRSAQPPVASRHQRRPLRRIHCRPLISWSCPGVRRLGRSRAASSAGKAA